MKRFLLSATLCLSASLDAASAQDLTFWHYWDGANGEVLQGLIDQYQEANPGVTIEAVFTPGAELTTKLQTAIAGRQTPTMAIADLVAMPLLTSSGALAPLDDYISASELELADYFEGPLVYGLHEGQRYSLPVSASNLGLFWNKELFAQAGLDPNTPPKTWDELVAFSKQIKEATGKWGLELYTQGGEGTSWQWQVYLWEQGGDVLSGDLSAPAFNSEAGTQALQFWVDLIHKDGVSSLEPWGLFGRGEAALLDGANRLVIFTRIVLPLSKPVIAASAIFSFLFAWNDFVWPLIVTNSTEMRPIQLGLATFQGQYGTFWTLLMAATVLATIPAIGAFLAAQSRFIEGITGTGLK